MSQMTQQGCVLKQQIRHQWQKPGWGVSKLVRWLFLHVPPKQVVVLTTPAKRHGGHYLTWESLSGPAVPAPVSFDTAPKALGKIPGLV